MVHGDIRIPNIVFGKGNSSLIARKVGTDYPVNYNRLDGRHDDAVAGAKMLINHDKVAFAKIIKSACSKIDISDEQLLALHWIVMTGLMSSKRMLVSDLLC